jgi:2-keto-4-pentenoate hydratase/2-oxohepta-3-ene-1,7-dioic acid hydratase in catechol pathway
VRLVTYAGAGTPRVGVIVGDGSVIALPDLIPELDGTDMLRAIDILANHEDLQASLAQAADARQGGLPLDRARLLAPIPVPRRNVFCVGWNYSEHFEEGKSFRARAGKSTGAQEIPEFPSLFSKNPATVTGPDATVRFPAPYSEQLDWEAELAVVIGEGGRDIAEGDAPRHVFGYTCANDVSVRDVQRRHGGQWFKGKNFDTHLPMGPWIVTADELDPADLAIRSRVNGVTKQDSRTRYMVFKVPRLVSELSAGCALRPGDLIITGTPAGVGFARTPPEYLRPGDTVEVEIEGIGVLRNRIEGGN